MRTFIFALAFCCMLLHADEGMWTFNNFPSAEVGQKYGFTPTQAWLDHVERSSVRLVGMCSGSLVSASGLVMTNHHCASYCLQQNSTAGKDYIQQGFLASTEAAEPKCPALEINTLTSIGDVTDRVHGATKGKSDKAFTDAQNAEISRIDKECQTDAQTRCDVVSLYNGGVFNLYRYHRYQDVRLVFAPETEAAFFGGDPDNFNFPRYDLDVSFMRIYEDGKPARVTDHFRWNEAGPRDNSLVFVSGSPGRTSRLLTVSQLEFMRDENYPTLIETLAELRGTLTQFSREGEEQKRIARDELFGVENSLKAIRGEAAALRDPGFFGGKVSAERELRRQIAADSAKTQLYGNAWDAIASAESINKRMHFRFTLVEGGQGFTSDLFSIARNLVRAAVERPKPNDRRLPGFTDSSLPALSHRLFSPAPIYPQLEELRLTFSLTKLREMLGADDPIVRKVLGKDSPETLAHKLVSGSKLQDLAERKRLWEGGSDAIAKSGDPMIRMAALIDPDARDIRKEFEEKVTGPIQKNSALIAQATFQVKGKNTYPDATGSPRLSFGAVKGWEENGVAVKPFTMFEGAFDRATGQDPYKLPDRWLKAKDKLNLATPFDFVSTNDIIGGNSGSPVIDQDGAVVGLIFDGNIHSLGGEFGFDPATNRAVAVTTTAITEALDKIYGAGRIVQELRAR
ncbi:MAG: S46 family peptidase [Acidobacteriota bacterium]|nr:S46 family peptidase [Acidobacteriota bacterium]